MVDYLAAARLKEKDAQEKNIHDAPHMMEKKQMEFIGISQKAGIMKKPHDQKPS